MPIDPLTAGALIQGGGALFNMFGKRNPARRAGRDLAQIQGYGREAYNPFIQQGQQANQYLSPLYQQQATNPFGQYNEIMNQYQPSAGYQYKQNKLQDFAHNTAASGGYLGTDYDVKERNEMISALLGEDMQQFLSNILGIQGAGQAGLEGQANRGFQAAGGLADFLGTAGSQQAGANYMKRLHGNESMQSGLGQLASLIGGGSLKIPGISGRTTPMTPLSSRIPNYSQAQSPRAASSGLFGGYGGF